MTPCKNTDCTKCELCFRFYPEAEEAYRFEQKEDGQCDHYVAPIIHSSYPDGED